MEHLKTGLEFLQMEYEGKLRLQDLNHKEEMKEMTDKFTEEINALKKAQQALRTEMEKQQREHQQRSAEVMDRHSSQLNELETSYKQRLLFEHQRHVDLQHQFQRMQEDHEKHLKSVEKDNIHVLEKVTQSCEAKLQEKIKQLVQCQDETQQQIRKFKETIRQVEEDEERKIQFLQIKYEKKLHLEKETSSNLIGKAGIMNQKFNSLQKQIEEKDLDIKKCKHEQQQLLGLLRARENDIEYLKKQIVILEKSNQDKDKTNSLQQRKIQELEKLRFVLEFQLNELKKTTEPRQEEIKDQRQRIRQLEEELLQSDNNNTQLRLSLSDLKLKLKSKVTELNMDTLKMNKLETHVQRLKIDLNNCFGFIQEPKKLKDSVRMIYTRYIQQTGVERNIVGEDVKRMFCQQRDHLEKTINNLKRRLTKSAEDNRKLTIRMMKENSNLMAEINALRSELRLLRNQVNDYKAKLAIHTKPVISKARGRKQSAQIRGCQSTTGSPLTAS